MAQYTINGGNNFFNNTNSLSNEEINWGVSSDRSQLLAWLSPLEPRLQHRDIQERRVNEIGEWLVQTEEFRDWSGLDGEGEGAKPILFGYGYPGVGKTFISSLVVDRLCDGARGHNTAVACFYFDSAAGREHLATDVLGSLLKQIVSGMERIPEEIWQAWREEKIAIGGRGLQLSDLVKMLQLVTSLQPTYMCIDGLDECTRVQRARVLGGLKQVLEKSPGTRMFVTGRFHIRAEVEKALAGVVVGVPIAPTKGDITGYLRARLGSDDMPDSMDEILEAEILEKIPQKLSEMFLLVSLNTDAILQESTIYRRRERLRKITDGLELGDAYGTMMERIKAQGKGKSRLGMAALMWVSHSERPLRAEELCYALAVDPGSTDFNAGNVPSITTVVGCCQGLITVDKEASTVRLIHFTLQEYLSACPDIFSKPHSAMAEICLTYLNSKKVRELSSDCSPGTLDTLFLKYCSVYWGVHAKRELSDNARSLSLELLRTYDGHISAKLLLEHVKLNAKRFSTFSPFSGLHCASFFGIREVVEALIEMKCFDIGAGDFGGHTSLAWAAYNGHGEVVEILLARGEVDPNKPNNYGQTPLSHAAQNGHEGVVKILVEVEGVNSGEIWDVGKTSLLRAAKNGHAGVVKVLLGRGDVNPDKPDNKGRTPLAHAAKGGHEEVVKMLLERKEVSPHKPDGGGWTPLIFAAAEGHEGIVKILLLRKEVNPNKPDDEGRTPLAYAADGGHEGVVEILLGRKEVDPEKSDGDGWTPLMCAASSGAGGIVKRLLQRKEVNPNRPDGKGQTSLSIAAYFGSEEVVKILLGQAGISPDKPDKEGQTPLWYAAKDGHAGMVKMLLGQEGVNPDKANMCGRTPLSLASENGHARVVKILLGREEVDPHRPDNKFQTPFMFAARQGHKEVMALLPPRRAVSHRAIC